MSNVEAAGCLATLSAAITALVVLMRSGLWRLSYALTAFIAASAARDVLILGWPERLWTAEFGGASEAILALLCALAGLELGRGVLRPAARVWGAACWQAALLLAALGAVGAFGLFTLGDAPRVGYRGLLVVDAAVAGLLAVVLSAVSLYELPRHPLAVTALRGLVCVFGLQAVYLGTWESSAGLAHVVGWAATSAYVLAVLAMARQAVWQTQLPLPTTAGAGPHADVWP